MATDFSPEILDQLLAGGSLKPEDLAGEDGLFRAGPGCLDSAPLDLSGFLPGYAERGALRFCRCVGRA
ncbi:hypothetical protein ACVL92_009723 [Bradyrhizobium liaoningense]